MLNWGKEDGQGQESCADTGIEFSITEKEKGFEGGSADADAASGEDGLRGSRGESRVRDEETDKVPGRTEFEGNGKGEMQKERDKKMGIGGLVSAKSWAYLGRRRSFAGLKRGVGIW